MSDPGCDQLKLKSLWYAQASLRKSHPCSCRGFKARGALGRGDSCDLAFKLISEELNVQPFAPFEP